MHRQDIHPMVGILTLILVCWIVSYGVARMLQRHTQYEKWTKKQLNLAWKKHWKFFVGFALGAIIAAA